MGVNMLPSNWSKILEDIEGTLTQSIQLAQAREAAYSGGADAGRPSSPAFDFASQLDELDRRAQQLELPLAALDEALATDEEYVRQRLSSLEEFGHRLANWSGGAIK